MPGLKDFEISYEYVEEIDPNLTCAICQSALVDPVTTTSCKHTFCRDCISIALNHQPQCPIDRSALTRLHLQDTEMLVKLMLDEVKVRCGSEGCGKVMERGMLLSHSRGCSRTLMRCTGGDCGLTVTKGRLGHHRAYECFQRRMECGECKTVLTFRHHKNHQHGEISSSASICDDCNQPCGVNEVDRRLHKWTCPMVLVPCTHDSRGCTTILPRQDLPAHLKSCPFEALSTFFEVNDARLQKLEDRNAAMGRTIDNLNAEVGVLKADLEGTKDSLAAVRRLARVLFLTQQERSTVNPSIVSARTNENHVGPENGPDQWLDDNAVNLGDSDGDADLARSPPSRHATSTVGSAPDQVAQLQFDTGVHRAALGLERLTRPSVNRSAGTPGPRSLLNDLGRSESYADGVFERLPIGATTEEAVSVILSILVRLGTGIDTVGRAAHLRTVTEVLRTQEEIASLRAIVNTLRMQVMIDRPRSFRRPMPIPSLSISPSPSPAAETSTAEDQLNPPLPHTPFSSYIVPPWPEPSDTIERLPDTDNETVPSMSDPQIRESVLFQQSVNRTSASSTSSLVSTGGRTGRPMGIPPPKPTDFSRVAAIRNSTPSVRPRNPIAALGRRLVQRDRDESRL